MRVWILQPECVQVVHVNDRRGREFDGLASVIWSTEDLMDLD